MLIYATILIKEMVFSTISYNFLYNLFLKIKVYNELEISPMKLQLSPCIITRTRLTTVAKIQSQWCCAKGAKQFPPPPTFLYIIIIDLTLMVHVEYKI